VRARARARIVKYFYLEVLEIQEKAVENGKLTGPLLADLNAQLY
jgi:hypothetical protein